MRTIFHGKFKPSGSGIISFTVSSWAILAACRYLSTTSPVRRQERGVACQGGTLRGEAYGNTQHRGQLPRNHLFMSKIFQEDPWEGNTVLDLREKARFCFLLSDESAEVGAFRVWCSG